MTCSYGLFLEKNFYKMLCANIFLFNSVFWLERPLESYDFCLRFLGQGLVAYSAELRSFCLCWLGHTELSLCLFWSSFYTSQFNFLVRMAKWYLKSVIFASNWLAHTAYSLKFYSIKCFVPICFYLVMTNEYSDYKKRPKLKLNEHYFLYEVTFEAVVGICLQREVSTLVHRPSLTIYWS